MERDVDRLFDDWMDGGCAAPLAVTGIRGCGKTRSVTDFLDRRGLNALILDYEEDGLKEVLSGTNAKHAASFMAKTGNRTLSDGDVIVVDGIRTPEQASSSAAMLRELSGTYGVIAVCNRHGAFGEGFEEIRMAPVSFAEYLSAVGRDDLAGHLRSGGSCPEAADLFQEFCVVGGLPGAVEAWRETGNENDVDRAIREVLLRIRDDAARLRCGKNMISILESIPEQLARENKKFMFSRAVPNARSKKLGDALDELVAAGAVRVVPIREEGELSNPAFKVYCFDTGALRVLYGLPMGMALKVGGRHGFGSGMTENAVLLELEKCGYSGIWCWRSGNRAEVEIVVPAWEGDVPVQVETENRFYARSLKEYGGRRSPPATVYLCPKPRGEHGTTIKLPLHAACILPGILGLPSDK